MVYMNISRHKNENGLVKIIIHDKAGKEVWKCQAPASERNATKLLEEVVHKVRNWESEGGNDLKQLIKECNGAKTLSLV